MHITKFTVLIFFLPLNQLIYDTVLFSRIHIGIETMAFKKYDGCPQKISFGYCIYVSAQTKENQIPQTLLW